jgi:uncharacterized DUF497 family protein
MLPYKHYSYFFPYFYIAFCCALIYHKGMKKSNFEWDEAKNQVNREKHGVSFYEAQKVFLDKNRVIAQDLEHSEGENRYYCFGEVDGGIMTVRFTYRANKIRIIGAGYWRKGKKIYENEKN